MSKIQTVLFTYLLILFASCNQIIPIKAFADDSLNDIPNKIDKKRVCLNMIVKNESHVITRCLASVLPLIDYWVIVDTGSNDGTQTIIKEYLKEIPGELHESQWINFAYNRNEALELAKGKADYILFIDADEMLEYSYNYYWPNLEKDRYDMTMLFGNLQYDRVALVKSILDWKWYGVLHEYLYSPDCKTVESLVNIYRTTGKDGHRSSDLQKFLKDARVLEAALKEEPDNVRYRFYLAQSYRDAGEFELAIENYKKRAEAGGWDQEVYYSLYQIAKLNQTIDADPKIVIEAFYTAFFYRPTRAEPLCALAKLYRSLNMFEQAYETASLGMTIPFPQDTLFVETAPYQYDLALECSVAAYWKGDFQECRDLSLQLLQKKDLPSHIRKTIESNLKFAYIKLAEEIINNTSRKSICSIN